LLYSKIKEEMMTYFIAAKLKKWLMPNVQDKRIVIYDRIDTLWGIMSKKQGVFAEFFAVLGALNYAKIHQAAEVSVQFSTDIYLDKSIGNNWWDYFFEPVMMINPTPVPSQEIHFNNPFYFYGKYGWNLSWSRAICSDTREKPYPIESPTEMKLAAALTKQYIRVKPHIMEKVDQFWTSKLKNNEFVIGIHFRGTDKKRLYPYKSPSYTVFEHLIESTLTKYQPSSYRIFIASDETEFIEWAISKYEDNVFYLNHAPRLSASDKAASRGGTHKSKLFSNYDKGETAVMDCLLLSKCNYLIKNRSSLSDISLAFNEKLDWTLVLDDYTCYSSKK